jgi:hypothetical protein
VNSSMPARSRFRTAVRALWLIPLATFGYLLAASPQGAAADGLLPTVTLPTLPTTVPTLPVTVPTVPLPTTTAGTGTTPATTGTTTGTTTSSTTTGATPTTTSGPGSTGGSTATTVPEETAGARSVAGVLPLKNGAVSIPVTSVRAPARLFVIVSVQPRKVVGSSQPIKASVQVRDTRGYLVRGAAVAINSVPGGKLTAVGRKSSAADGRVAFVLRLRKQAARPGTVWLRVSASDPSAPRAASGSRGVSLLVKPKR